MEKQSQQNSKDVTLWDLFSRAKLSFQFLLSKWIKIIIAGAIGGSIGVVYAYFQPIKYTAKLSFVVEDAKSGVGGIASLAGQFGIDLGGSGGGGVFSGDNILIFLKSEGLIRETLLTFYDEQKKTTLADQYAIATKMKPKWARDKKIGPIDFTKYTDKKFPRKEDSLMQLIVNYIRKVELSVGKPDKKASFIEVKVSTRDEQLSKLFAERLVSIATQRYVESKISTKTKNIDKLQRKADSLSAVLNSKTFIAASSQQSLVDANPAMRTAPIAAEISTREKTMAGTIFAEVIKNLEISKTILSQETPVIQIVDNSTLPLQKIRTGKLNSLIWGGLLSSFLFSAFLLFKRSSSLAR